MSSFTYRSSVVSLVFRRCVCVFQSLFVAEMWCSNANGFCKHMSFFKDAYCRCVLFAVVTVIPIPKSNKLSDPGNYRPISLTCILCKLLEKHMYNIMYHHLVNNNQLSDSQWGFRSGRSTVCALLSVTHDWFAELEILQKYYFCSMSPNSVLQWAKAGPFSQLTCRICSRQP